MEQDSNPDSSETFPCPENTPPACATPPVLFVHGFLASGDTFSRHSMLYQRNGFLPSQIHVHDWDSFDQEKDHSIELDQHIDAILDSTECEQLILMGHSAGGGLSVSYLESAEQAAKVSHYVHIGSFGLETLPLPDYPDTGGVVSRRYDCSFRPGKRPSCVCRGRKAGGPGPLCGGHIG